MGKALMSTTFIKMTRKEQAKILDDKTKANNAQYDVNRLNAEISAYSSGDLDKYEFLTKQDLKYKPDALEQAKFTCSPLGKVFNDGLNKKDNTKKVGILQRLKNIEDNLNSNNDNGNRKVGIFQIIKDIKDKGIKISNDNEAIREIREHIQNLRNKGVKVNNFDEISKEIRDHIQNLKDKGIDVNINNNQVNENKILKGISKRDSGSEDSASESEDLDSEYLFPQNLESFFKKYKDENIKTFYKNFGKRYDIDTYEINNDIKDYNDETISKYDFSQKYNTFIDNFNEFEKIQEKKNKGAIGTEQKKLLKYGKELKKIIEKISSTFSGSKSRKGLKILTPQQMLTRLPILLAQIKAGNNSRELKNEIRQLLYSLYRSRQISKTIYKNLIATI